MAVVGFSAFAQTFAVVCEDHNHTVLQVPFLVERREKILDRRVRLDDAVVVVVCDRLPIVLATE